MWKRALGIGVISLGVGIVAGTVTPRSSQAACSSPGKAPKCCTFGQTIEYCFETKDKVCVQSLNKCKSTEPVSWWPRPGGGGGWW